ncbi:hypothetical protein L3Q82_005691 [Scortum barcoo]|uniref:Uncharacterized protein n=1 Tax=Scortum barcoo TaxID=214431 RepID=A0ACB8V662_9TELE|nr:hypothetical protein L3Q82_005691 [Scortum barcoo]
MSESAGEWEDSFDAFASSRLNSPKASLPQKHLKTNPTPSYRHSYFPVNANNHARELRMCEEEPPPLPPRRLLRTSVNELYSDGWLHRGQELAVHKEAYLLSQTGVASLQRGREGESKRNSISPETHTSSENSDSLSVPSQSYTNVTSPGFMSEGKLKKFKYEPLEDDTDCWGGMLFEQDLYGRVCRANYGQPKVNSHSLLFNAEETAGDKITSMNSGPKMVLETDAQSTLHPTPVCCPSIHPSSMGPSAGASATLAVAPYTSSYSTTSTTDQPLVDARHSLLPEETQPASSLPHQESRPHPVKPLTSSQSEKKDSRSVLEKLKSTIHPGRTAQQAAAEPEKSQEVTVDNSAQYRHLTNMELIALLLQQEMDMQKQQAASQQQEAQLHKCEAELKKVKAQVRDLEDYIDNLLLRIIEQTPTLLQGSFLGRLRHFIDIIDPSTLFVSEKRLKECIKLLDDYKHGTLPPGVSDLQLWEAQKIKQAIIHPDTGEKIFMPFRMSGYVPFGTPIWLNQSHNACVNYANRNATKVGLNVLIQKANKLSPATRMIIQRLVPFPAVASANICNVGLMRHNELSEGIDVLDNNGNVVGSSKIAARHAITETAFTRVVLPMPIFVLPPIIMSYPREIEVSCLEPEIAMATDCKVVTYNKGL